MDRRRWWRVGRVAPLVLASVLIATTTACAAGTDGDAAATDPAPTSTATSTTSTTPGTPTTGKAATTSTTGPPTTTTVGSGSGTARAAVDRLEVAEPDPAVAPYRRAAFGDDWDYDPTSGCNTRERVLIEESLVPPVVDDRCRSTGGRWTSAYDGAVVTDVADLQIDHLVPLADAWRSGAATWTDERRRSFANDLTDPATLIAVTGSTNQSKSDSSPDRWLPPDRSSWCAYASDWVSVKATWALTVTPAEKATLVQVLSGC